jgi:hypothetical protein
MQRILDPKLLYGLIGIARASDHDTQMRPVDRAGPAGRRLGHWIGRAIRCFLEAWGTVAVGAIVWEAFGGTAEAWVMSPMISGLTIALFGRDRESAHRVRRFRAEVPRSGPGGRSPAPRRRGR